MCGFNALGVSKKKKKKKAWCKQNSQYFKNGAILQCNILRHIKEMHLLSNTTKWNVYITKQVTNLLNCRRYFGKFIPPAVVSYYDVVICWLKAFLAYDDNAEYLLQFWRLANYCVMYKFHPVLLLISTITWAFSHLTFI